MAPGAGTRRAPPPGTERPSGQVDGGKDDGERVAARARGTRYRTTAPRNGTASSHDHRVRAHESLRRRLPAAVSPVRTLKRSTSRSTVAATSALSPTPSATSAGWMASSRTSARVRATQVFHQPFAARPRGSSMRVGRSSRASSSARLPGRRPHVHGVGDQQDVGPLAGDVAGEVLEPVAAVQRLMPGTDARRRASTGPAPSSRRSTRPTPATTTCPDKVRPKSLITVTSGRR